MNGNLPSDMQILYNNDIMYIFVQCEREKMGEMSEGNYKTRKSFKRRTIIKQSQ